MNQKAKDNVEYSHRDKILLLEGAKLMLEWIDNSNDKISK